MTARQIVVLDIETTGLSPVKDCIVEIGICLLDLKSGATDIVFDQIVREKKISPALETAWIFQNTDLSIEDVLKAPELTKYSTDIQEYLTKYPATAYNKKFDFGFLQQRGFSISKELPCPMIASTNILKLPHKPKKTAYTKTSRYPKKTINSNKIKKNSNQTQLNPISYKWPSVEEAWRYYFPNEEYVEIHRAGDDAQHEAQIVFEMYQKGHIKINFT